MGQIIMYQEKTQPSKKDLFFSSFSYNETSSHYFNIYSIMSQIFDTIIIGAGSAGLPAGMYASRYKLSNIIIGELPGGALGTSHCVENWPGVLSAS